MAAYASTAGMYLWRLYAYTILAWNTIHKLSEINSRLHKSEHETPYRSYQRLIPGRKSNTVQTWRSNSCMHKPDLYKLQGAQGIATISSLDWQDRERHGEEWEHVTEGTVKRMKLVDKEGKLAKLVDDLCHELHPYSGYLIRWFWQHKTYLEVMKNPPPGSVITVLDYAENMCHAGRSLSRSLGTLSGYHTSHCMYISLYPSSAAYNTLADLHIRRSTTWPPCGNKESFPLQIWLANSVKRQIFQTRFCTLLGRKTATQKISCIAVIYKINSKLRCDTRTIIPCCKYSSMPRISRLLCQAW